MGITIFPELFIKINVTPPPSSPRKWGLKQVEATMLTNEWLLELATLQA